jgi:hypothetical protein
VCGGQLSLLVMQSLSVRVFMNYCLKDDIWFYGVLVVDLVIVFGFSEYVISFHCVTMDTVVYSSEA